MRRPLLDNAASFDQIVGNMKLIQEQSNVRVHLRINVDKSNIDSAHELLLYCSENDLSRTSFFNALYMQKSRN